MGEEGPETEPVSLPSATISLNTICPYFTMFPLEFPLSVLEVAARPGDWVLDPFCGRGTTNFAARTLGLGTVGFDSSPVATAVASAKLAMTTPEAVVAAARGILAQAAPVDVPIGAFWELAYHPTTLLDICRLRAALLTDCRSDARRVLRAVVMGALHGPRNTGLPSYFSNQSPRTFAPKPAYAVKFWTERGLTAPCVDALALIERRARRALAAPPPRVAGFIRRGDSRAPATWDGIPRHFRHVITSPPYYGMVTYVADQWLRAWFVGGSASVDYRRTGQICHRSIDDFREDLASVWRRAATVCLPGASMVVRFGAINDRALSPAELMTASFDATDWQIVNISQAGSASCGKRQANHFGRVRKAPIAEVDVFCRLR
jgi:hypothetical protein